MRSDFQYIIDGMGPRDLRNLLLVCWDILFFDDDSCAASVKDLGSDELAELVDIFRAYGLAPSSEPEPESEPEPTGGSPSEEPPTMNAFARGRMVRTRERALDLGIDLGNAPPDVISYKGRRLIYVGFGWVDDGQLDGTETIVT